MIKDNAYVTILLCSYLGVNNGNYKPYTALQWSELGNKIINSKIGEPAKLLNMDKESIINSIKIREEEADRIVNLLSRGANIAFLLEDLSRKGISIVTRSDIEYPKKLKSTLKKYSPPILFYCGDLSLANKIGIGIVGSRNIDDEGIKFTQLLAKKAVEEKLVVFSGGAKGVDEISETTALNNQGYVVSILADSLSKKIMSKAIRDNILSGKQLLLTANNPDAPFSVANAMNRNKYIYALSNGTFVVASDYNKGGTYHAEKICLELSARNLYKKSYDNLSETEKDNITSINGTVRMCCFHPSYGYEDFIEGIKPRTINGQTVFDKEDGIFKKICNAAQKEPNKKFYLIIDEINRGDISRIFGELIMLIESGKRNKTIILPLSKDVFSVPENLYIIGTMNTADRSISMLDVALRRRFGFIELMPEYSFFKGIVFDGLPLDIWLKELNKSICDNLGKEGRNLQIGHSYFFDKGEPIRDKDKFKRIIKEDVIPLIEEYSYGDYSIMAKILGDGIIDTKNQTVRFELFNSSTSDLTNALLAPCPEIRTTIDGEDEIKIVDEETGDDDE
jgi:predicted Rossmann fold nucleotide-binding protein DprA/Smf involved in DNA uptake